MITFHREERTVESANFNIYALNTFLKAYDPALGAEIVKIDGHEGNGGLKSLIRVTYNGTDPNFDTHEYKLAQLVAALMLF